MTSLWQPPEILFPDAEAWAIDRLKPMLLGRPESYVTGAKVMSAVPPTMPARLVTIRRDGGAPTGVFDNPRFGVNVWAANEADVADLAEMVNALLRTAVGDDVCVSIRQLSGPSPIADSKPRRYSVFQARLRGEQL
jgi:hypothetical protein